MRNLVLGLFLVSIVLLTGCIGTTTQHTATPIPTGDVEFGVVVGAFGAVTPGGGGVIPNLEFDLRYGVSETVDFGVKLTGPLVTADVNVALMNSESFALSLDPTLSAFFFSVGGSSVLWFHGSLPVLADVVKSENFTLVTGAKIGYIYVSADSAGEENVTGSGDGLTLGGTVGAKFQLSKNFAIMPSFDIMTPTNGFGDAIIYNAALGFLF